MRGGHINQSTRNDSRSVFLHSEPIRVRALFDSPGLADHTRKPGSGVPALSSQPGEPGRNHERCRREDDRAGALASLPSHQVACSIGRQESLAATTPWRPRRPKHHHQHAGRAGDVAGLPRLLFVLLNAGNHQGREHRAPQAQLVVVPPMADVFLNASGFLIDNAAALPPLFK